MQEYCFRLPNDRFGKNKTDSHMIRFQPGVHKWTKSVHLDQFFVYQTSQPEHGREL